MGNPNRSPMVDKHIAALKAMKNKTVEAGWFASDRYGSTSGNSVGEPVARIARINEFGATIQKETKKGSVTIIIPSRPFMRGAWMKFRADRQKIQAKIAKQIIDKKIAPDQALAAIGSYLEGYIVKSI